MINNKSLENYSVTIAQNESDFEEIFKLNHQIFAEELSQHSQSQDGILVDKYHDRNTYFMVKKQNTLIGMIAVTNYNGVEYSVESKLSDKSVIEYYRGKAIEIRLLSVKSEARRQFVTLILLKEVILYAIRNGFDYALISGVDSQLNLYKKLGFQELGPKVQVGSAFFTPMVISFNNYSQFVEKHPLLNLPTKQTFFNQEKNNAY